MMPANRESRFGASRPLRWRRGSTLRETWRTGVIAVLWILLSAASICLFAGEPSADPRSVIPSPPAPEVKLSAEEQEIVAHRDAFPGGAEARLAPPPAQNGQSERARE